MLHPKRERLRTLLFGTNDFPVEDARSVFLPFGTLERDNRNHSSENEALRVQTGSTLEGPSESVAHETQRAPNQPLTMWK